MGEKITIEWLSYTDAGSLGFKIFDVENNETVFASCVIGEKTEYVLPTDTSYLRFSLSNGTARIKVIIGDEGINDLLNDYTHKRFYEKNITILGDSIVYGGEILLKWWMGKSC